MDTIYGLAARIVASEDVDDRNKRRVREILRLVDLIKVDAVANSKNV